MRKSWLLCVLLGAQALGQAAPGTPPPPAGAPGNFVARPQAAPAPPPDMSASVPSDAAVITVLGICPAEPEAAAKPGAAQPATAAKAPAAETPAADCKTVITKAEFEKLANAVAPTVTPQLKKQLANILPQLIAMSSEAKKIGLDKTPRFDETVEFAKMQILKNEMVRSIQEEGAKVPPEAIATYYKEHSETFEQYNLDRLFVPRTKQDNDEEKEDKDDDKNAKLTDAQQKAKAGKGKGRARRGRAGHEQTGREPAWAGRGGGGYHEAAEGSLRCRRHEN